MTVGSAVRGMRAVSVSALGCIVVSALLALGTSEVAHAAASSPAANPGQLFGVHPVQQGSTTLPGGHFNFALVPGQSITDGVVIENFSSHVLNFHVYGADLLTALGGGLAPAQPTATMHEAGAWITVSVPTIAVAAHGQLSDAFTLRMPAVVATGQHLGAIVVAADVGTTAQGSPIEARVALITVVTVPGVAYAAGRLTPLIVSSPGPGQLHFGIALVNTGNILLTYAGSVVIAGDDGHSSTTLTLLPSDAYAVPGGQVPLAAMLQSSALPIGNYRAQATIVMLADGKAVGTLVSESVTVQIASGVPTLAIIAGAIAVVAMIALAITLNRRRNHRRTALPHAGLTGLHGLK